VHLAGFTDLGTHLFDTHSRPVDDEVWRLYAHTLERMGPVTTMVEWDDDIPPWSRLVEEIDHARRIHEQVLPMPEVDRVAVAG
jgi:uncharacterized protein (UPF0276 family)